MERALLIWQQYRASMLLKPYPSKQCSSAHNHHQSCHCITIAKPSLSCLVYFLYHLHITRFLLGEFLFTCLPHFYCTC